MSELRKRLEEEFEKLKTHRDELRVKLDLGKMEARDAWQELDGKWGEIESKLKQLAHASSDTADEVKSTAGEMVDDAKAGLKLTASEVGDAAEELMKEIREGFARLRKLL